MYCNVLTHDPQIVDHNETASHCLATEEQEICEYFLNAVLYKTLMVAHAAASPAHTTARESSEPTRLTHAFILNAPFLEMSHIERCLV